MKHLVSLCIAVLALATFPGHAQKPNRALPDDNLAYPVLITFRNGTGSGFYLNTNTATYLVTAKHVLFDVNTGMLQDTSFDLLSYSRDLADPTPNLLTIDTDKAGPAAIIKHPTEDVAVIKVLSVDPKRPELGDQVPGIVARSLAKLGLLGVSMGNVKTFNEVLVGNDVIVLGYPTSLGLQTMPEIDSHRPLLRKGIVAGQNPQTHSIILDCPVYFGNSGGPVIESDPEGLGHRFKVIGVVNKYVPYADGGRTFLIMANSGYSVVTPMDYVLELIK